PPGGVPLPHDTDDTPSVPVVALAVAAARPAGAVLLGLPHAGVRRAQLRIRGAAARHADAVVVVPAGAGGAGLAGRRAAGLAGRRDRAGRGRGSAALVLVRAGHAHHVHLLRAAG